MLVWRIARKAHQEPGGKGAELYGGRWNSEAVPVVYTSSTLALAALEYLAHVDLEDVPDDLVAMSIEVPDDAERETVTVAGLPADWARVPDHAACAALGDDWVGRGAALVLRLPSAVVPEELNVLINPAHRRAADVAVASTRPFAFDPRLL